MFAFKSHNIDCKIFIADATRVLSLPPTNGPAVVAGQSYETVSRRLVSQSGEAEATVPESGNAGFASSMQSQPEALASAERVKQWLPSDRCDEFLFMSSEPEKLVAKLHAFAPRHWAYMTLPEALTLLNDTADAAAPAEEAVAVEAAHLEADRLVYDQKTTLRHKLYLVPPANQVPNLGTPAHPAQQ